MDSKCLSATTPVTDGETAAWCADWYDSADVDRVSVSNTDRVIIRPDDKSRENRMAPARNRRQRSPHLFHAIPAAGKGKRLACPQSREPLAVRRLISTTNAQMGDSRRQNPRELTTLYGRTWAVVLSLLPGKKKRSNQSVRLVWTTYIKG